MRKVATALLAVMLSGGAGWAVHLVDGGRVEKYDRQELHEQIRSQQNWETEVGQ